MIEIKNLCKSFDGFQALTDLNLHVREGSIYGLIGVNGSGKTTLIRHLTGILRADSGSVVIDGEDAYNNINIKKRLGYIPDELFFFGSYSLKEMAKFYKGMYPTWNQARCDAMTEDFGLSGRGKLSRFSKGMQKQAQFILTMSCMPDFLILDEPIDGLDPIVRRKVWNYVVEDVSERNMTVLVSSHNLKEMEGICDSIGILSGGQMKIERDLDELKSDIHKVQTAFAHPDDADKAFADLDIMHRDKNGSVEHIIVRGNGEMVEHAIRAYNPLIFDMLPLTLEEVFIYEMGGENHDIHEILA